MEKKTVKELKKKLAALLHREALKKGKFILSSFDSKSGKIYPSVDFTCNKTGTYQIYFDFRDFQPGLGVGIVSLVK